MPSLPEPSFIDRDPAQITADLISIYEQMTGKVLYPAQPERVFIDLIAYRENLLRIQIQLSCLQNLVSFAGEAFLPYLGELVDCNQLGAQAARAPMRFTLIAVQDFDVPVPAGSRVQSKDGQWTFATDAALTIPAGQLTGDVTATADAAGAGGNGYLAGEINDMVDPVPYVQGAVNTSVTVGGAEIEDPERYRGRIMLSPEHFSSAGPEGAYIYWAKTAHPLIIDVKVTSPSPGVVNVYPLMTTGLPSDDIRDLVAATLTAIKVRPLTDNVAVISPAEVQFSIMVAVTLLASCADSDDAAIVAISALIAAYTDQMRAALGKDIVKDDFISIIKGYRGAYNSVFTDFDEQALDDTQWANCTAIAVTIAGRVNG